MSQEISFTPELIISLISATTALIGVIVSPFVSYKITKKQIETQNAFANSDRSTSTMITEKESYANTIYNFSMRE